MFSRLTPLTGDEALERLGHFRVILFGTGGVGSWAAEGLIRSGIRHLTLVDHDTVAVSNLNRQLPALHSTIGHLKAEVLSQRLLDINPEADITVRAERYTAANADSFGLERYTHCIDAIDSLADKQHLILHATSIPGLQFYSSMGAARKLDPARISVDEFWKVKGCPLAAALRSRFRKSGIFPKRKFLCVHSEELTPATEQPGSACHITAIYGMTLAGLVVKSALPAKG